MPNDSTPRPPFAPDRLSHAGGVVVRETDAGPEVLLVRAKPAPHDWVLPKGHIEKGETPEQCARREIQEEAGVDAQPIELIGYDEFTTPQGKYVAAAFYVMRYVGPVEPAERRESRWLPFGEALATLPFDGARRLIERAHKAVT